MIVQPGDLIEHTWDETYGIVYRVNPDDTYVVLPEFGEDRVCTKGNFMANMGTLDWDYLRLTDKETADLSALHEDQRVVYAQMRARWHVSHDEALLRVRQVSF